MRNMKTGVGTFTATATIVFAIGASSLVPQTPTAAEQPNLQSTAETVSLDLAVHDKHNKSILDLKPDELSVADNGKPAKLTDLRLVNGDQQDEPLITLLFDRPGMDNIKNRSEDFLFGTSPSAARDAGRDLRQMASRFLSAFPSGGFRFAVVDVWGRMQIQQEYSANRKATAAAISTAVQPAVYGVQVEPNAVERRLVRVAKTGQDSQAAAVSVRDRALARSMVAALQASSRIAKDQHLSPLQACLLALVETQQSLPGRKAIVYFNSIEQGSGDPSQRSGKDSHAKDALKSIIGAANRAGVNIYVVLPEEQKVSPLLGAMSSADLKGGIAGLNSGPLAPPSLGTSTLMNQNYEFTATARSASKSIVSVQEDMDMLAKQTGGDVLIGSGRLAGREKELVRNLTTYYEASFVPSSGAQDGSFHTTAFRVSRKGIRMGARTGYLAIPPNAGITEPVQPFEVPLMAMLARPQLPADLDYRARVMHMEDGDEGNVGLLALEVPMSGVQVRTDTSTRLSSAHVSVFATINDSAGTQIERFSEDIVRRWSSGDSAGTAPAFISFERSFAAPPGTYVLETAILDNDSGKAAAKRQTFEVSASSSVPELSDLMVVRGIEPADNLSGETDLLWGGERQVLPNLYGELPSGAQKVSVFFVAHTDPKSQAPATVKLEVLHDGSPLKGKPLTSPLKAGDEFSPMLDAFSVTAASNGKYEVRVTLVQGEKSAEKTAEFDLTGEEEHLAGGAAAGTGDAPAGSAGAALAVEPPGLAPAEQTTDRPAQEELDRILADARKNALDYGDALPNLICRQTTQRLFDATGKGDWRLQDTYVDVLTYLNHEEHRTLVGTKSTGETPDRRTNMTSTGQFGASLADIFRPESKARFTWKEMTTLRGEPAEVFDYRVEQENSDFLLNAPEGVARVSYHGRVYIDRATHGVKSLTVITDEQPKRFFIRMAAIRVDYDYVAINDHDYLLPVTAQVVTRVGGDLLERNDLTFSDFRRFGSNARIVGAETEAHQQ